MPKVVIPMGLARLVPFFCLDGRAEGMWIGASGSIVRQRGEITGKTAWWNFANGISGLGEMSEDQDLTSVNREARD
jgi:hypothetical protein